MMLIRHPLGHPGAPRSGEPGIHINRQWPSIPGLAALGRSPGMTPGAKGAAQRRARDPYPLAVVMDSGPRGLRPLTRNDAEPE